MAINIEAAFLVSLIAITMTTLVVVISARLSQKKNKDEIMDEIKKYNELSRDASDVGAKSVYAAFQKQGNETLMQYFMVIYKEAVLELALHVLTLGMLQKYYPVQVIDFPFNVWVFGDGLGSVGWYIISAFLFFFLVIKRLKPSLRYFRPNWV